MKKMPKKPSKVAQKKASRETKPARSEPRAQHSAQNQLYLEMVRAGKISSAAIRLALNQSLQAITRWEQMDTDYSRESAQKMRGDIPVMEQALQIAAAYERKHQEQVIDVVH